MENKIIEIVNSSLDVAEQILKSQIPEGYKLVLKKIISDGRPKSVRCVANTAEEAFQKALSETPKDGQILSKIELAAPGLETITIKAYNEAEAFSTAKFFTPNPLGENIKSIRILKLVTLGRRGFLFIKGTPNIYEIEIERQSVVEISYKLNAKIVAEIGLDKESLIQAVRDGNKEICKHRMTAYLINVGKISNEIAEIVSDQLNIDLLDLLKAVLYRCQCYKVFVHDFIKKHYFSLGPKVSILLSTYFITEAIEKYKIVHESDIRHLLYLLQPQQPPYSRDALDFDKELDVGKQYNETLEKLKPYSEFIEKLKSMAQHKFDPKTWDVDTELINAYDLDNAEFSELISEVEELKERLEKVNLHIELEKTRVGNWLTSSVLAPKEADLKEKNAQTKILSKKNVYKQVNFHFFEILIGLLRENDLHYEASCFCDSLNETSKNELVPQRVRAVMTRSRAEFLKLSYRNSIQVIGEQQNLLYKIQGPVYFTLDNLIQECDVNFLIVGPTVEQITLKKASEGDNRTGFEVKPGRYIVVCEPKKLSIPPLIFEGYCLPGRQYHTGIQLVQQQGLSTPPIVSLGSGVAVDSGLFGAIDIDPRHSLEFMFNGQKYEIQNYLGEGSGGIVYQTVRKEDGNISAFKFMTSDLSGNNSQIEFGKQEWQVYNSLESKQYITGILGYSESLLFIQEEKEKSKKKRIAAYQMEYANQGSLASYLANKQDDLSPNEIITMLKQISIGLGAIHKAGLMHRDIRPQNILVFQDNPRYRICDFTLTKSKKDLILEQLSGVFNETGTKFSDGFVERRTTSTLQSLHRIIGSSTFYAAPEEHDGSGAIDDRSDIYSVGGVLYWLLTGFEPFELILRERYQNLYERYKLAMENHVLKLDFQHRKALFGNLRQLDLEMRNTSLRLKKQEPLNIEEIEIQYSGISENLFLCFKNFISRTIQPDPSKRFQSVLEMQAAINEMEKVT